LKQEEKVVPVQPSAVAAIAIAVDAANVTEAAGMQEKEASKAQQEPESVQTQSSADEAASAARETVTESSAAAALSLCGKSSYVVQGQSVGDVDGIVPSLAYDQVDVERILMPALIKRATKGRHRYSWKRISVQCFPMKIFLGALKGNREIGEFLSWWLQLRSFASKGSKSKESIMTAGVLYIIYVSLQAGNQGDIYKLCFRELGKSSSEIWGWSHSITSTQIYEGLQPWPPPCSLRTSCLSGRGVVLWTSGHGSTVSRQE
jgi:hypothetical protein